MWIFLTSGKRKPPSQPVDRTNLGTGLGELRCCSLAAPTLQGVLEFSDARRVSSLREEL